MTSRPALIRGRDVVIENLTDDAGQVMAYLKMHDLRFDNQLITLNRGHRSRHWLESCADSGRRMIKFSGSGVLANADTDRFLMAYMLSGAAMSLAIVFPAFMRVQGPFVLAHLSIHSGHDEAVSWLISLQSAGDVAVHFQD